MWHIYVLELENGCFYIGITYDVNRRFSEHIQGLGANFTRNNKPLKIHETYSLETTDKKLAYKMECKKTIEYAFLHGPDKVKGGKYFNHRKLDHIRANPHTWGG